MCQFLYSIVLFLNIIIAAVDIIVVVLAMIYEYDDYM